MGIILASNGVIGALATQILTPIIYGTSDGWRTSYRIVSIMMLCIGVVVVLFLRNDPRDVGAAPLGSGQVTKKKRGRDWVGISSEEAFRKPYFYICAVCVFLTGMLLQSATGVASAHMMDRGISAEAMAAAVSAHAIALTVAKIVAGISFDKFGLRATLFMGHAIAAVSIFMLAMVTGTGYVLAGAYEILVSFALPLETIMLPLIAADMFGEKAYAKMMGLTVSINTAGYALGGPVANWFRDTVGTYKGALLGMSALMIVILVVFQFALVRAGKDRKKIIEQEEATV
jgi:MFS family permease